MISGQACKSFKEIINRYYFEINNGDRFSAAITTLYNPFTIDAIKINTDNYCKFFGIF